MELEARAATTFALRRSVEIGWHKNMYAGGELALALQHTAIAVHSLPFGRLAKVEPRTDCSDVRTGASSGNRNRSEIG